MRFAFVQHQQAGKPAIEQQIFGQMVCVGGALEQFDLCQHFEFFALFVEIDEIVGANGVRYGRMDHGQIGEKGAEIRYRAVTDVQIL